MYARSLK